MTCRTCSALLVLNAGLLAFVICRLVSVPLLADSARATQAALDKCRAEHDAVLAQLMATDAGFIPLDGGAR